MIHWKTKLKLAGSIELIRLLDYKPSQLKIGTPNEIEGYAKEIDLLWSFLWVKY